jgi:hypothetical protein
MRLGTRSLRASAAIASVVGGASGTDERGGPRNGGRPPDGRAPPPAGRGDDERAGGTELGAGDGVGTVEDVEADGVGVTTGRGDGVTGPDPLRIT